MRTFVHIGQHKTGTTSIQHFLQRHREMLGKQGLYVPDNLLGFSEPSHFLLNVYALDKDRMSSKKEKMQASEPIEYFLTLHDRLSSSIQQHYDRATENGCVDVVWSNEGLYLLNSIREYERLRNLFDDHSTEIIAVCCFREVQSYRASFMTDLEARGESLSDDKTSYRYLEEDSWLFDYERKESLLNQVFDDVIVFPYNSGDMVNEFMSQIGRSIDISEDVRLNVSTPANRPGKNWN